ncbi:hypothetical protein GCK32_021934, partial [Trichostrongylus colubriformis]
QVSDSLDPRGAEPPLLVGWAAIRRVCDEALDGQIRKLAESKRTAILDAVAAAVVSDQLDQNKTETQQKPCEEKQGKNYSWRRLGERLMASIEVKDEFIQEDGVHQHDEERWGEEPETGLARKIGRWNDKAFPYREDE